MNFLNAGVFKASIITSTGAWAPASDRRLKKNIKEESCPNLAQAFLDMKFYTYDFKDQTTTDGS